MSAMFNDLMALSLAWKERAQKCRDEAHDQTDWENPGTGANKLLVTATTLEYCAQELQIALQIQDL